MKPSLRFGFNSLSSLADMLRAVQEDCEKRARSYDHNPTISDRWVNAADAIRLAAKAVQEQLPQT